MNALSQFDFTPPWLQMLSPDEREEVVAWLENNGVKTRECASFEFDGKWLTAHMYAMNADGTGVLFMDGEGGASERVKMADDIVLVPSRPWPEAVDKRVAKYLP